MILKEREGRNLEVEGGERRGAEPVV